MFDTTGAGTTGAATGDNSGSGSVTGQQTGQTIGDWRESIPADLRDAPGLKDVKDIGSLAKQFIDQQRFLGNSIRIPGEDAGEPGRKEFLEKLQKHAPELIVRPNSADEKALKEFWELAGVPADENGYEVDPELQVNEDWLRITKANAKKYGLTKTALKQFVKDHLAISAQAAQDAERTNKEAAQALANEWGAATDGRINDVRKFAEVMQLPDDFREALDKGQVSPAWMKAIHGIIQQFGGMGENKTVAFQPGGSIPDGPEELKAKINEIEKNPAFLNARDPQHKALVDKRVQLFQQLNNSRASN